MAKHLRMPAIRGALLVGLALAKGTFSAQAAGLADEAGLPSDLRDTGLYLADSPLVIHPDNLPFSPQYPLWSDGAAKRRWLNLPPGTFIDASRLDAWSFPVGTRLWKEFSYGDRKVETRFIERRVDGTWRYASYLWNEAGTAAVIAPSDGAVIDVPAAPAGRHEVPSKSDCLACHEGAAVPVLGAGAVQLLRASPAAGSAAASDDKPFAAAPLLQELTARGQLRGLPPAWRDDPPGISAASPTERDALGYLHGNCGHCHNSDGAPAAVPLVLAQSAAMPQESRRRVLRSAVSARSRYRPAGMQGDPVVIAPGQPEVSVLVHRMQSRHPLVQMPPLGTLAPDDDAVALIRRWIANDLSHYKEDPG